MRGDAQGRGPEDLTELSVKLAAGMVFLARQAESYEAALDRVRQALEGGAALEKFRQFIGAQGGREAIVDDPSVLPMASERYQVRANAGGYIASFNSLEIGMMVVKLGGGRRKKEDSVDLAVGLEFVKKPGDAVEFGDEICTFYHHPCQRELVKSLGLDFVQNMMVITTQKPQLADLVMDVLMETV